VALWHARANIHNQLSWNDFEGQLAVPGPLTGSPQPKLQINVVFTSTRHTPSALAAAARYARDLDAQIHFLVIQAVPVHYSSLSYPPVSLQFVQERARRMALACAEDIEIRVQVYLCGDSTQCILRVLKPHSVVIIGGSKRWWRTHEDRLAAVLRSNGHRTVLIDGRKHVEPQLATEELPETQDTRIAPIWIAPSRDAPDSGNSLPVS